jgi:sulfide:quinone oxidoreductase
MTSSSYTKGAFHVFIAGGGVAGLEAALALRELAAEQVATTMIAPDPEFVYRPMIVREPFGFAEAQRYPLAEIAQDIGLELRSDAFKWLDGERRILHPEQGEQWSYDALLLALGARLYPRTSTRSRSMTGASTSCCTG